MEFENFYNESLLPALKPLEETRKELLANIYKNKVFAYMKNNLIKCCLFFILTIGIIFVSIFFQIAIVIGLVAFILLTIELGFIISYIFLKGKATSKYKLKVKEAILKKYLGVFGKFTILSNQKSMHTNNSTLIISGDDGLNKSDYTIKIKELIELGVATKRMIKNDDDVVYGAYNGTQICLNDTHISLDRKNSTDIIFQGLIAKIYLRKNYLSKTTLISKETDFYNDKIKKISKEFYDMYTDNEELANQFFDNKYEKLRNFEQIFPESTFKYCLKDDIFYFMINNEEDFFDFSNIDKTILDINSHKKMFNELRAIFDLFDYLIENKMA